MIPFFSFKMKKNNKLYHIIIQICTVFVYSVGSLREKNDFFVVVSSKDRVNFQELDHLFLMMYIPLLLKVKCHRCRILQTLFNWQLNNVNNDTKELMFTKFCINKTSTKFSCTYVCVCANENEAAFLPFLPRTKRGVKFIWKKKTD